MNRREFVKALAGVPLLGLLARLPEMEIDPTISPAVLQKALAGIRDAAEAVIPRLQEMASSAWEAKRSLAKLAKAEEQLSLELPNGNLIFYDPDLGNDASNGLSPATAVATLERALALASAPRGDCIIWM